MGKTKHDLLLHVLEELLEEEIKKFKFKLNYMDLREGYKNIPKGHLEKADVVQLVILLIEYYQEEYAVEVAINVLDDINNKMLADWLRKASAEDILQEPRHKAVWNTRVMSAKVPNVDHRGNYIASIKEQFRKLKDYNSKPGEWVSLEDRYTKLFIVKKYHQTQDKEHELLSRGKRHTEIMKKPRNDEDSHITVEHLFDTLADGTSTKKVILQGVAGIGKTSTVCKIMYDWACGKLYQGKFDYIFHWSCRELNQRTETLSLAELILQNWKYPKPEIKEILSCPDKVLFIIDGFDELRSPKDNENKSLSCDLDTPHSTAAAVVESLLSWRSLSEVCLLVTTRPSALEMLETHLKADRWAEIMGFLEEEREEYFKKFFRDEEKAALAYSYIQDNDVVFTMCFVPLICWIVCTSLCLHLSSIEDLVQKVSTTTQVFTHFVTVLLQSHGRPQTNTHLFHNLGLLAYSGMKDQEVLFEESTLKKYNLEMSKDTSTFLTQLLKGDIIVETVYSFVHLTIQELFAALFTFSNKEAAFELLKEAFIEKKSHLSLTIRFLFGLNNDSSLKPLKKYYTVTGTGIPMGELLKWTKKSFLFCQGQDGQSHFLLELLHCLFEIQDEEFVRNALEDVKEMVFLGNNLGQDDQQVILYSLQHAKELHRLTLVQCELKEKYVIKLLPLLGKCKQIYLSASGLSLSTVNTVCAHVLQSLRMTRLHLVYEEDDRMNCTVEASRERDPCIITFDYLPEETVTAICDQIIPAHPGIVRLDVNGIQGRQGFLTALKYSLLESECKLETLGFNIENPKHEAFRNICEHLATHHSPGKFALFRRGSEDDIHFGYEAKDEEKSDDRLQKKKKSKGRKGRSGTQPQCFPLTWFLKKKKNREDGIAILSCLPKEYIVDTVLWVTSKFTPVTLVMDDNSIDDELMETICEKLNNAEYKLQLLSLNSNILAQESMTSICSLFHCNTAVSLSLRYNPLGDEGVKILAACLKSKGCTLKNLSLSSTDLTEDCVPAIASLFSKKNTLIQLDLSFNNLSNSGVKTLCSALKNKESHLEELKYVQAPLYFFSFHDAVSKAAWVLCKAMVCSVVLCFHNPLNEENARGAPREMFWADTDGQFLRSHIS
ncbi:NACHT, LRR and PYD domains-containing protein 3 isoform X1 [Alligator mississippiensis]|uniref:NACHT, LRR and PYD domains-containing protein 3 isoform X1 n=1 Tax=Alligator mississippiensis TaxID=8496 RepID=UPI0009075206|nr:NACHT, LRR and PYD domains-containing protein 3 isoform X1 [Alligator mississippiensis]XP_019338631.1 NACHT, LRR and PYD domains-containing protein 3 isoform X1 [Alligator mississippiensis]